MSEIKEYTNSVQHNVLATVIDKLNKTNCLTFINVNKISTDNSRITKDIGFKISTIHGMSEILKEIHALGYKITKGK